MSVRVECAPANEADIPRMGQLFEDALGPTLPAMFPDGLPPAQDRYVWRSSVLKRSYLASNDPQQQQLRGPFTTNIWKATLFRDDNGPGEVVGALTFTIVPAWQNEAAREKIKYADSLLPPVSPAPAGFNAGAMEDMMANCQAFNTNNLGTHSRLSVNIFVVDPATQGTGVGSKLFNVTKTRALETQPQPEDQPGEAVQPNQRGIPLALNAVPTAVGFYLKHGLRDIGEIDLQRAKNTFHGMLYQEPL